MASSLEEPMKWLFKAERTLQEAVALADAGLYGGSVSRAYYAMFYAAKAAVVSEGVRSKKHSGVISMFGRLFTGTGRLDPRFHRTLIRAFRWREEADYLVESLPSENEARDRILSAEEFVRAVKALLISGEMA
ncbi:MAG: HEPN domain-containing protein [Chloroflexota bacterium]|nr:MAG: HEPN domain-containing protein [Chloroflexota bacterium]